MKILAIDTSTRICSAALVGDGKVIGESLLFGQKNHSEKLLIIVHELLKNSEVSFDDLDIIAVATGPGSFTGLRVGISTAQGLAFSLGKDLVGVSTLEVLASQGFMQSGYVCPMIDAGKQQVYTCLYKCSENGRLKKTVAETVIEPRKWLSNVSEREPILFLGDGAYGCREKIASVMKGKYMFLPGFLGIPRASTLANIASNSYLLGRRNELQKIVPLYLRPPDAEMSVK